MDIRLLSRLCGTRYTRQRVMGLPTLPVLVYPAALSRGTPKRRSQVSLAPPSPTPSTVSLAPTVDEDGWWT